MRPVVYQTYSDYPFFLVGKVEGGYLAKIIICKKVELPFSNQLGQAVISGLKAGLKIMQKSIDIEPLQASASNNEIQEFISMLNALFKKAKAPYVWVYEYRDIFFDTPEQISKIFKIACQEYEKIKKVLDEGNLIVWDWRDLL